MHLWALIIGPCKEYDVGRQLARRAGFVHCEGGVSPRELLPAKRRDAAIFVRQTAADGPEPAF